MSPTIYADRSERGKLRFTGPQRAWFLHQIMTQAFEDMQAGEARPSAMITANGRMVGYLETVATADAIYAHFEAALIPTLPEAIGRYVLATQVEIAEVTDEFALILVAGDDWRAIVESVAPNGAIVHPTGEVGVPGAYLWVMHSEKEGLLMALGRAGLTPASDEELESIRVEAGIPRWGRDMDERTIPLEVGLAERAIHFSKGCYVGQEAMAKIHFRGKPNRLLRRVEVEGEAAAGDPVREGDAEVGRITTVSGRRGLAVLRHTVEPGAELRTDHAALKVLPSGGSEGKE